MTSRTFPGTAAEESELLIAAAFGCDCCHPSHAERGAECTCQALIADEAFARRAVAVRRYGRWVKEIQEHRAVLALNGVPQ